jgi:hypothetical protein
MSHDDRIKQLTDLFIEDLRGPIDAAMRQLLSQVMGMASQDQTSAVDDAVSRAAAEHQAALDAAAHGHEEALSALRAELTQGHEDEKAALRADLTQAHDTALAALRDQLAQGHDEALAALREELSARHAEELAAVEARLAEHHGEALDRLRTELADQHDQDKTALRAELGEQHEQNKAALHAELTGRHEQSLAAALQEASAEHDTRLQGLRDTLVRDHEAALDASEAEADARNAAMAALREELAEVQEALEQERAAKANGAAPDVQAEAHAAALSDARAAALAESAEMIVALQRERDVARGSAAELADQLAAAHARHEQLTTLAHAESQAASELSADAVEAHVVERQSELACSERVLAAMRLLDAARTLSEVLTVLADHTASEGIRVAVLLVQGARLRGWRFAGMGDDLSPGAVDVALDAAGVIGQAALTAQPASSAAAGESRADGLPPFLVPAPDRVGLALPIVVGGRVVAVVYVDDAATEWPQVPSNWPEVAEVLSRHAGRCLEVLTLSRATAVKPAATPAMTAAAEVAPARAPRGVPSPPAPPTEDDEAREEESARRHARLLISEIKLYNQEAVELGRRDGNLLARLGSEIERARRLYEEKIPAAVRQRVECFDEEIVRTLAGGDRALLGQVT